MEECLSKLILSGERPLSRTLAEFSAHYQGERNHQGKDNKLLSRMLPIKPNSEATRLSVASDSEVCSSSMPTPHEFFDHTVLRCFRAPKRLS
jgi:hypothetical protein